ncbi:MAG: FMN-binding glutamate synthase family protein, partial [Planctomycetota bacterium]
TQDPALVRGLDGADKRVRVHRYHHPTVRAALEILGAAGLDSFAALEPSHLIRRLTPTVVASYAEIYDYLRPMDLLHGKFGAREDEYDAMFRREWDAARSDAF